MSETSIPIYAPDIEANSNVGRNLYFSICCNVNYSPVLFNIFSFFFEN